jgi:hypothetical protein
VGFEFNINAPLGATMYVAFNSHFEETTGNAVVQLPTFVPQNVVNAPQGATHFKFVSAAAAINFEDGSYLMNSANSSEILLGMQTESAITLTIALTEVSSLKSFLLLGIEFYQEVNGTFYPLKSGSYNALAIVAVDGGVTEPIT